MSDELKKLPARFFRPATGNEPVRETRKTPKADMDIALDRKKELEK